MIALLVLVAITVVVIGPLLAIIAFARTQSLDALRRSVAALEAEVSELKRRVRKVFLYDLGELRDPYRVVSLVGLAISLLLVSLLYQRFVFRRPPSEET